MERRIKHIECAEIFAYPYPEQLGECLFAGPKQIEEPERIPACMQRCIFTAAQVIGIIIKVKRTNSLEVDTDLLCLAADADRKRRTMSTAMRKATEEGLVLLGAPQIIERQQMQGVHVVKHLKQEHGADTADTPLCRERISSDSAADMLGKTNKSAGNFLVGKGRITGIAND